jgi:hypothetical protein
MNEENPLQREPARVWLTDAAGEVDIGNQNEADENNNERRVPPIDGKLVPPLEHQKRQRKLRECEGCERDCERAMPGLSAQGNARVHQLRETTTPFHQTRHPVDY